MIVTYKEVVNISMWWLRSDDFLPAGGTDAMSSEKHKIIIQR